MLLSRAWAIARVTNDEIEATKSAPEPPLITSTLSLFSKMIWSARRGASAKAAKMPWPAADGWTESK